MIISRALHLIAGGKDHFTAFQAGGKRRHQRQKIYLLWHFIHAPIAAEIKTHSRKNMVLAKQNTGGVEPEIDNPRESTDTGERKSEPIPNGSVAEQPTY